MLNNYPKKLVILAIISFMAYLLLYNYTGLVISCFFHKFTGLYCPGCGVTRMLKSLINLEIKKAFCYNQFVFILTPFLFVWVINRIKMIVFDKESFIPQKIEKVFWYVSLCLAIIFGIFRNIPYFDFLRP